MHLYPVVSRLSGFIFTKYSSVFLRLSLHLHPEGPLGSPDPDGELAGSSSPGVADEPALVPGQDSVLHSWSVHPHLAGVGGGGHSQVERGAGDGMTSVLDTEAVPPSLLRSDVQSEPPIPVIVQLAQGLLAVGSLALDGELVLAGRPGVDDTLDLLA